MVVNSVEVREGKMFETVLRWTEKGLVTLKVVLFFFSMYTF